MENELRRPNKFQPWRHLYIMSVMKSTFPRRKMITSRICCWDATRYPIEHWNNSICPLLSTFTRGRIETKPVSNCLHAKLEICGDMSPLFTTWLTSSLTHNTPPRQLLQMFCRWSLYVWSLSLSIMRGLGISLPWMWSSPPRFIVGGMRKSPGLM